MTRGRLSHSHLNGGISIEQRRPANLCILNEPLWSNVATRVNLPSPETLTGFETSCWTIHWHHKVHRFQEFWEGTDRPSLKQGRRDGKWRRDRGAGRQIGGWTLSWTFELLCWWLLVAFIDLFLSVCHYSWELRVKRDLGRDVRFHSAGSAAVEELYLQKKTNSKTFSMYAFHSRIWESGHCYSLKWKHRLVLFEDFKKDISWRCC